MKAIITSIIAVAWFIALCLADNINFTDKPVLSICLVTAIIAPIALAVTAPRGWMKGIEKIADKLFE